MKYRWLLWLCLLLPWTAMAAQVQATLDRNDVHLGDTVMLKLRIADAMTASTPDLSALDRDFDVLDTEVLDTSSGSLLNIINGKQSAQLTIGIVLRPKHQGDLQIPSLTVAGSQTNPLTLHVGPPDSSAGGDAGQDVFVEAQASTRHAYVGQQVLYTVRLFYAGDLSGGSLPNPDVADADLRQLGNDINYEAERNSRRYHVVERRYALTPRHAGSLLIPSIEFQGEMLDRSNPNDPGGFFNPGGLFGNTTPVTADSPEVKIDVQAPPADWGQTTWLPARSLTLSLQGLPSDDKLTAGQPLNLRLVVAAQGLSGDALPQLSLPTIGDATVYPDQPTTSTHDDGEWLTGHSERGFAIIPQHAGTLTLPAITLTWFDVQSGQKKVATIPAHTFTVLPGSGAPAPAASANPSAAASPSPAASSAALPANNGAAPAAVSSVPWRWIALGSLALWLLGAAVVIWLYVRRKPSPVPATPKPNAGPADSAQTLRQAFLESARGDDRTVQARRLLAWARAERPGLRNLGQLAEALASAEQRAAIGLLQREQYAGVSADTRIDLATIFAKGFVWQQADNAEARPPLPPLYPFKLD